METKEWKQFSDLVDKHNKPLEDRTAKDYAKAMKNYTPDRYGEDVKLSIDFYMPEGLMEKTLENFWEWKIGKLKLTNQK